MSTLLLTVAAIWTVAAITPGPNFFFVVHCALTCGRKTAMAAVAGVVTGTLCWGLAGWLGVSALFMAAPLAYMTLKMLGSLYLTWLGLCLLWNLRHRGQVEDSPAPQVSTVMATWRLGFVTNLANPKTAVFVASLFSAMLPPGSPWSQGPIIIAIMMAISIVWYVVVAVALSRAHTAASYRRWRRWIDAGAGLIFVGFGLKLAFIER